jgi:hypothetical protein
MASSSGAKWAQKTITLPPLRRGCHLITPKILKEIREDLSDFNCGLAHVFLQHTSASLTINENYDPDVQADTEFLYLSLSLLLESSVSSSSSSSEKWPMVRIFSHLSVTMELEW